MISGQAELGFAVQNGCRHCRWKYAVPVCAQGIIKTKAVGGVKKKNFTLSNKQISEGTRLSSSGHLWAPGITEKHPVCQPWLLLF